MNANTKKHTLLIAGYYRAEDGSLSKGNLALQSTPSGYAREQKDSAPEPVEMSRYQSIPGSIDVKFTSPGKAWTFLASAAACERGGVQPPPMRDVNMRDKPIDALRRAAEGTDAIAMMGEPDAAEVVGKYAPGLRDAHIATLEMAGEMKRAFYLMKLMTAQTPENKHAAQVKDSLANMERILTQRFGIPLDAVVGKEKTAERQASAEATKTALDAAASGGDRGR